MARSVVEDEDVFEDLEDLEIDEEEAEDLDSPDDEDEEYLDDDDDEEEEPAPRKRAKAPVKKRRQAVEARVVEEDDDPTQIIKDVLVKGIVAYIDAQVDKSVARAFAAKGEDRKPVKRQAIEARKPVKKARQAPPPQAARKAAKGAPATTSEVREWLQEQGYDVSDRGRISVELKKVFTKKTGRRIAA